MFLVSLSLFWSIEVYLSIYNFIPKKNLIFILMYDLQITIVLKKKKTQNLFLFYFLSKRKIRSYLINIQDFVK